MSTDSIPFFDILKDHFGPGYSTQEVSDRHEHGHDYLTALQKTVHAHAKDKGFWDSVEASNPTVKLALVITEVAEAIEAIRETGGLSPSDHIPQYSNFAEELADTVIRVLDLAERFEIPLYEVIEAKVLYNQSRPHKHGKKF